MWSTGPSIPGRSSRVLTAVLGFETPQVRHMLSLHLRGRVGSWCCGLVGIDDFGHGDGLAG